MARSSIIKSLEAERDLQELFAFISSESGVQRAELILRRIEKTLNNLADWPFIGRIREELGGDTRTFSIWPWIIFYEPQPDDRGIIVWRVVDGRRDLSKTIR